MTYHQVDATTLRSLLTYCLWEGKQTVIGLCHKYEKVLPDRGTWSQQTCVIQICVLITTHSYKSNTQMYNSPSLLLNISSLIHCTSNTKQPKSVVPITTYYSHTVLASYLTIFLAQRRTSSFHNVQIKVSLKLLLITNIAKDLLISTNSGFTGKNRTKSTSSSSLIWIRYTSADTEWTLSLLAYKKRRQTTLNTDVVSLWNKQDTHFEPTFLHFLLESKRMMTLVYTRCNDVKGAILNNAHQRA